jgi:protein-tyrosine phosphatase
MGAVHGVYLKYVGLSAISLFGYHVMVGTIGPMDPLEPLLAISALASSSSSSSSSGRSMLATSGGGIGVGGDDGDFFLGHMLLRLGTASLFGYSALINGAIAIMFRLRRGMSLIGKDTTRGTIPTWSYAIFFPFHLPTYAYTYLHTRYGTMKHPTTSRGTPQAKTSERMSEGKGRGRGKVAVPVASEVQPGWWVGGCYANRLDDDHWAGIVDLTVEFPERCRERTLRYLCLPTWDGVPCTPDQLEKAATFCVESREEWNRLRKTGGVEDVEPRILVHCAHGRGRSTTVMCAALVKMGLFPNYIEALERGIQPGRPCCKLNAMMRANLAEWQRIYVDGKKGI